MVKGEKYGKSKRRDCREIGYRNTDIDPHFKFKFVVAPVGIQKDTHRGTEAIYWYGIRYWSGKRHCCSGTQK
jgi:hypothetical protein